MTLYYIQFFFLLSWVTGAVLSTKKVHQFLFGLDFSVILRDYGVLALAACAIFTLTIQYRAGRPKRPIFLRSIFIASLLILQLIHSQFLWRFAHKTLKSDTMDTRLIEALAQAGQSHFIDPELAKNAKAQVAEAKIHIEQLGDQLSFMAKAIIAWYIALILLLISSYICSALLPRRSRIFNFLSEQKAFP